MADLPELNFNQDGLVPAIVQDFHTREVLMMAYMNDEALRRTVDGPDTWFFSRSRNELWHKGATSGNFLKVVELRADCDGDTLLVLADPSGPACHTGNRTCFFSDPIVSSGESPAGPGAAVLDELFSVIEQRMRDMPDGSYTTSLLREGVPRIAQKVIEEAGEVVIAAVAEDGGEASEEMADLLYHSLVLLAAKGISPSSVWAELSKRRR